MAAIARWMEIHEDLDDALRALRRVWPEGRAARQRRALDQLVRPLELHIELEERVLMPVFAEIAGDLPPNAQPHVYLADHAQLRELVHALEEDVGAESPDRVLAAEDRLGRLAGVLEHHDLRERTWFVPALDAHVAPEVAEVWVADFARAQSALPPAEPLEPLPALARPVPADLSPVDAFRITIARDGDVRAAFDTVRVPDHPKGPRRYAQCASLVQQVTAASSLVERRDRLAELADAARLFAIVARSAGDPP